MGSRFFVLMCVLSTHLFHSTTSEFLMSRIKVAYLFSGYNRHCLQIDFAEIKTEKSVVDIGSAINVSRMSVTGQFCNDFSLSEHVDGILIVIPGRVNTSCFHFSDCKATIIIKNPQFILGSSSCYDVAVGQYIHAQNIEYVQHFAIKNMVPHFVTCNKENIDKLVRPAFLRNQLNDIWSPVEDIEKEAISQISKLGEQFATQITQQVNGLTNQLNTFERSLTDQFNVITATVSNSTAEVTETISDSYAAVSSKLDKIDTFMAKEVGTVEKYFHYFIHALQIIGLLVVLGFVYRIYKKAHSIFNVFSWIWTRLTRRHPQHQQVNLSI